MAEAALARAGDLLTPGDPEPAAQRARPSRRRGLGISLLFAAGAAALGASLGLVAQPKLGPEPHENLAWTTAVAVQAAARAEERAQLLRRALDDMKARLDDAQARLAEARAGFETLSAAGAVQEQEDAQEAQRLGVDRLVAKEGAAFWGDDRRRVLAAIVREARRHGLDPLLVAAVIEVESRFDPFAVSRAGARGLMQLMPPTAQELPAAREYVLKARHLFNPVLNVELGTAYLAQLMSRFDGDLRRALIAYNAGPAVARSIVRGSRAFRRLEAYPKAVFATYRTLALAQQRNGTRPAVR